MPELFATVLVDASFAGVAFPVARASLEESYDVVEHAAYRRDGADLEPAGRRARRGELEVPLLNDLGLGELFPGRYYDLLRAISGARVGALALPTRGTLQAAVTAVREELDPAVRSGVVLHLAWVEHDDSAGLVLADLGSLGDAPATATARARGADAAMAAADPTRSYAATAPVVAAQLAALESLAARAATYGATVAALRTIQDVVDRDMALPAFASVAGYGAVRALADLGASVAALRSRYLPSTDRIRQYTVRRTAADFEIAQEVYGDARRAALIRRGNPGSLDYLAIPQGTVLTILPAD